MINYPKDFNISSDYATISAVDRGIMQLTLPKGLSVAGGMVHSQKQEIQTTKDGILRLLVSNSRDSSKAIVTSKATFTRTFLFNDGTGALITILISGWRESKNKVVCALSVSNPYAEAIVNPNETEVFYIDARTVTFPY